VDLISKNGFGGVVVGSSKKIRSMCDTGAYRPVALLNCLGKVLEKLMASRLAYLTERHGLLHEDQIRGRRQRSAIDAAMALTHEIDKAKHSKEMVSTSKKGFRGYDRYYRYNCKIARIQIAHYNEHRSRRLPYWALATPLPSSGRPCAKFAIPF
jgi:hypothetical protein